MYHCSTCYARYHLASARHVYEKHYDQEGRSRDQEGREEAEEGMEETEEAKEKAREKEEETREKVAKCCGLLARLEGKYGLGLLEESRREEDRLQQVGVMSFYIFLQSSLSS